MQENKKPSISLWVGLAAIGLTFLSVFASACGVGPRTGNNDEERALEQIARALGTSYQPGAYTDKKNQCSAVVSATKESDYRSEEELMNICLSLPPTHVDSCGLPASPGEYFELEEQRCVTRVAGIQQHAHARKVETRERPMNDGNETDPDDGSGTVRGAE